MNLYLGFGMRKVDNINIQSAVLHMLGDAVASAGVIIGGVVIAFTKWYVVDPILSVLIAILIAFGAWRIVKQTIFILMEGTPKDVDFQKVVQSIQNVAGILDVHDLHIWSISSKKNALSCHVVVNGAMTVQETQSVFREVENHLVHLGVGHVTIQA